MDNRSISLIDWSGRANQLESKDLFQKWIQSPYPLTHEPSYKPPCTGVPARLRGKSSTLSRLVMEPFLELVQDNGLRADGVDFVFASRFGEIQVLESLFNSIFSGESVSPLDFCNSVHHTATGYTSIAAKNQRISRTVSANEHSFAAALVETYSLLATNKSDAVMLLVADEKVPELFFQAGHCEVSFGVALLFQRAETSNGSLGKVSSFSKAQVMSAMEAPVSLFEWLALALRKGDANGF